MEARVRCKSFAHILTTTPWMPLGISDASIKPSGQQTALSRDKFSSPADDADWYLLSELLTRVFVLTMLCSLFFLVVTRVWTMSAKYLWSILTSNSDSEQ